MRHLHVLRLVSFAAVCITLGCKLPIGEASKTDPANGTGTVNSWSFTISPSHNDFTVQQGATDTMIVTITRVGGFTGPVNFEVNNPDSGVTVTSEPITATGAITTTRILTKVAGPHQPFASAFYSLHAAPVSTEVEGQFLDVKFSIVRKNGTFIIAPATLSVGKGQSVLQRISIIRTNYDLPVPMTLFNAPAGVTATFSPNPVLDTVTQVTLSADISTAEGSYSIGVRANEGTTFQGTAPVTLTVTPAGSISISTPINPLAVPKNSTVPAGINIARTNYTGPVTITVTGVPAGVTTVFVSPVTGNSVSISFTNSGSGVPGPYPVVITASGQGLTSVSITLTINVS